MEKSRGKAERERVGGMAGGTTKKGNYYGAEIGSNLNNIT
jgi:hypothetical protein